MFVQHVPRYGLISQRQQNLKAHISRAMTPTKFVEHKLLLHMFI